MLRVDDNEKLKILRLLSEGTSQEVVAETTHHRKQAIGAVLREFRDMPWEKARAAFPDKVLRLRRDYVDRVRKEAKSLARTAVDRSKYPEVFLQSQFGNWQVNPLTLELGKERVGYNVVTVDGSKPLDAFEGEITGVRIRRVRPKDSVTGKLLIAPVYQAEITFRLISPTGPDHVAYYPIPEVAVAEERRRAGSGNPPPDRLLEVFLETLQRADTGQAEQGGHLPRATAPGQSTTVG